MRLYIVTVACNVKECKWQKIKLYISVGQNYVIVKYKSYEQTFQRCDA